MALMGKLHLAPQAGVIDVLERALLLVGKARSDLCDARYAKKNRAVLLTPFGGLRNMPRREGYGRVGGDVNACSYPGFPYRVLTTRTSDSECTSRTKVT